MLQNAVFAQEEKAGSYLWNTVQVNYQLKQKYELVFTNRIFYNTQIERMDFYYFDLTGYRTFNRHLSMGLGYRNIHNYKVIDWKSGNLFFLYGIYNANPGFFKLKIATRVGYKHFKTDNSQIGLDNISTIDLFANSARKFPKPYLTEEAFSELKSMKIQHLRLFAGLHLLKKEHWGFDVFYARWKSHVTKSWENNNILGVATKINI
jgi:hypothetical protein